MEPTAAGPALYLIQIEMGGTAGPYDLGQLRELLELDRANPNDRLVHVGTRQGVKMLELIPDAAEIHRKRKSDRLRRRSDRLESVQPVIPKAHDLPAEEVNPEARPVDPAAPIDLKCAPPAEAKAPSQTKKLVGIVAATIALIVLGSFVWETAAEYFSRISPRELVGTWQIELAQRELVPQEVLLTEAQIAAYKKQFNELKIMFTADTVTLAGPQARVTNGWKVRVAEGSFLVLDFTNPTPPLGDSTTIVRVESGLGIVTPLGLAILKKQP